MSTVQPITARQAGELCRLLEERGIGDEEFQTKLIEGINGFVSWMRGGSLRVFPVTVDYSMSLELMIASGRYDWVNPDITSEHFPVKGTGTIRLETQLINFVRPTSSEFAIGELDKMGLRPAILEELLAFGAKYPEEQLMHTIIALGSVGKVYGYRHVACLGRHDRKRYLYLNRFDLDWYDFCLFLAVRK